MLSTISDGGSNREATHSREVNSAHSHVSNSNDWNEYSDPENNE